jgi:transglutaminase-like putative cysteine protease
MELGLTRRNIGRLVLLSWAVMLAWLARREFTKGEDAQRNAGTTRLAPAAQFFGVYAGGRQIGQLNLTVDTLIDGVRVNELFVLDVPYGNGVQQLTRGSEYTLTRSLRLRRVSHTIVGIGPQERLDGDVDVDSTLRLVHTESPLGVAGRARIPVHPDDILPTTLPFRVAFSGRLHAGAEFSLPLIDLEGGGRSSPVSVRVTAESTFVVPDSAVWDSAGGEWVPATTDTIRAWRIEHDATGAPTVSWVDAGGVLVHEEIGGGVTLHRSAFEIVRENRQRRRSEPQAWRRSIPGMRPLAASGKVPDTLAASRGVVVETDSGLPAWRGARALAGGRQRMRGADTIVITRATPADSEATPPTSALGPTWDVPMGEADIGRAAREAVAGAVTAEDSARRLTRWVARQIATDIGSTASGTALFTLHARRGTADGKARLLAAMARAQRIPARVVSGLAVLADGSYGHAWTELWVGRWVAADPTFGHFPASASLLRLAIGSTSRPIALVLLAGSARFLPIRAPR